MSDKYLHIGLYVDAPSKGVYLPLDAATQRFAYLGRTGSGKSYGASKTAEEFLKHHIQLIVLDPVGVWNGLRTAADGKGKGFPIPVFGGEHGDVPLTAASGTLIANLIVEKEISAVLDVSQLRKGERKQFVTDFAEQFFHLKKRAKHRSPVHFMIEEAQTFIPQRSIKGEERMLGAMEDIIKLGRNYGIGVSLITQRPQSVHKDCLNQTEALFAFQTNGPHERKAIEDWIVDKGLSKSTVGQDLASLKVGTCFLWSPQWLKVLERIQISKKLTFDASETPKVGVQTKSRTLAPVDLDNIRESMQQVINEKAENDPAVLRKKISELQKELNAKPAPVSGTADKQYQIRARQAEQKLAAVNKEIDRAKKLLEAIGDRCQADLAQFSDMIAKGLGSLSGALGKATNAGIEAISEPNPAPWPADKKVVRIHQKAIAPDNTNHVKNLTEGSGLPKCERAILTTLVIKAKPSSKSQIGIFCGYSPKSGGFNNALGKLRSSGYIDGRGEIVITDAGLQALGSYEELPQGEEQLHLYWFNKLPKAEATILRVLVDAYPNVLSKERIGELANYSSNSGGFNNALGKLRTLELIGGYKGNIKASDSLFN